MRAGVVPAVAVIVTGPLDMGGVGDGVGVGAGVPVGVAVGVTVGVAVGVELGVADGTGVGVGTGVSVQQANLNAPTRVLQLEVLVTE